MKRIKYLIFAGYHCAVVNIPSTMTGDQYGELQDWFAKRTNSVSYATMRTIHESDKEHGVYFHWELSGPDGASYELFQFPDTPDADIEQAKTTIRWKFDVTSLRVRTFRLEHDIQAEVDRMFPVKRDFGTWHAGCGNGEGSVFDDREGARMRMGSGGTSLTPICTVHDFDGDRDDLVRLIAAAPEMLATLESMLEFWAHGTPVNPGSILVEEANALVSKIRNTQAEDEIEQARRLA